MYEIRALDAQTWNAFETLCSNNNGGGMGGCWCTWFHEATMAERRAARGGDNRAYKERRVRANRAHAAVVFDGDQAIGWCQFGSPEELPGIAHRADVEIDGVALPDYRITCFTVDRRQRRQGIAELALGGALNLIAEAGGGVVEAYPYDVGDRKVSGSFLFNGTRAMFERAGFRYERPKGKNHCVMRKKVKPAGR